jgi:membrane-associated protein
MTLFQQLADVLKYLIDVALHLDRYLNDWANPLGLWLYVILFVVIFCETGLVVTPFLPGDSLLFAVGALASTEGSRLQIGVLLVLLTVAAIIGDAVNYAIGRHVGPRVFTSETSWLLNKKHLLRTQAFYEKHGAKTIVLARFMPIVRTFAPFVAGIGGMSYKRFSLFNVTGGIAWVFSFLIAGYFFGGIPTVKRNFHVVILAIIVLSVMPVVIEFIKARREKAPALP